jgi:hypothetical protein
LEHVTIENLSDEGDAIATHMESTIDNVNVKEDENLKQLAESLQNGKQKDFTSAPFIVDHFYFSNLNCRMEKVKKYFRKKKLLGHFDVQNHNIKGDLLIDFYNWLIKKRDIKIRKNYDSKHLGYINDQIYLYHNPVKTPPPPADWDILCLSGEVLKYNYSYYQNNVYWCKADMNSSNTFVINFNNLDSILIKIKKVLDENKEYSLNTIFNLDFKTFIVTQYYFTQNYLNSVEKNKSNIKDALLRNALKTGYYKKTDELLNAVDGIKSISENEFKETFLKYKKFFSKNKNILPTVSFIVPLTDPNTFWFNVILFNTITYPKKEMIIVDFLDLESKIKRIIQNDTRFKLIKLSIPKDRQEATNNKIPMGYIINSGIQCSNGGVIVSCFDKNYYNANNFDSLIYNFLISNKECFIGTKLATVNLLQNYNISEKSEKYNLSNFIFTKDFWKIYSFDELEDNQNSLIYNFIKDRKNLISFYPSQLWNLNFILSKGVNNLDNESSYTFNNKEKECFTALTEVHEKKHEKKLPEEPIHQPC